MASCVAVPGPRMHVYVTFCCSCLLQSAVEDTRRRVGDELIRVQQQLQEEESLIGKERGARKELEIKTGSLER